jgi:hypothetical protein
LHLVENGGKGQIFGPKQKKKIFLPTKKMPSRKLSEMDQKESGFSYAIMFLLLLLSKKNTAKFHSGSQLVKKRARFPSHHQNSQKSIGQLLVIQSNYRDFERHSCHSWKPLQAREPLWKKWIAKKIWWVSPQMHNWGDIGSHSLAPHIILALL